jgi:hypothetical protein
MSKYEVPDITPFRNNILGGVIISIVSGTTIAETVGKFSLS